MFPLGSDFDQIEQRILPALVWLKENTFGWRTRLALAAQALASAPTPEDSAVLERLGLSRPRSLKERVLRRVVGVGLARTRA